MIVMEFLTEEKFALLNTADDTNSWNSEDIKVRVCGSIVIGRLSQYCILYFILQVALRDLAQIHSVYLDDRKWLNSKEWLERKETNKTVSMTPLWRELVQHGYSEFPEFWHKDRYM